MTTFNTTKPESFSAGIVGLATHFPEIEVDDSQWDKYNFTNVVTGKTPFDGVQTRLEYPSTILPSDAGAMAGQAALNDADIDPNNIDLVMSSSLPADKILFGDAGLIIEKMGLKNAAGLNIEAACASSVSCLILANSLIRTGTYKNILIVNSSFYSRVKDISDSFSVALGDSVGAMVVTRVPEDRGYIASHCITDGFNHSAFTVENRRPNEEYRTDTTDPAPFFTFDYDLAKSATRNSKERIVTVFNQILEKGNLHKDQIDLLIPHQGVHWLPDVWADCIGMAPEKVCHTFEKYGSNASSSVPVNLDEARKRGLLKDGANIFMFQIGSGFHYNGVVMRWYDKKQYKVKSA